MITGRVGLGVQFTCPSLSTPITGTKLAAPASMNETMHHCRPHPTYNTCSPTRTHRTRSLSQRSQSAIGRHLGMCASTLTPGTRFEFDTQLDCSLKLYVCRIQKDLRFTKSTRPKYNKKIHKSSVSRDVRQRPATLNMDRKPITARGKMKRYNYEVASS